MRRFAPGAVALALLSLAEDAAAQWSPRLDAEIRGGVPVPVGEFRAVFGDPGTTLQPRGSVGVGLVAHLTPAVGVYGGLSVNRFRTKAYPDVGVDDEGFDFGVLAALPSLRGVTPRIRSGITYHEATVVSDPNAVGALPDKVVRAEAPGRELGFELGGVLEIPLWERLWLIPGAAFVHYRSDEGFGPRELDFVRLDVGVRYRLLPTRPRSR